MSITSAGLITLIVHSSYLAVFREKRVRVRERSVRARVRLIIYEIERRE